MQSGIQTKKIKPPRARRSQRTAFDLYLADTKEHDQRSAQSLAVVLADAKHDADNSLARTMVEAANAREALDTLRNQIDAHESFAERHPQFIDVINSDLVAVRRDINGLLVWCLTESRRALIGQKDVA